MDYSGILESIRPGREEYQRVMELSERLVECINGLAAGRGIDAEAFLVGSVAKGTWLSGGADIDIFIHFPLDTPQDDLKEKGLKLGYMCIERFQGKAEERYASHPYVTGYIDGYEVDFVPCYRISNASELRSAVDRTILHTEYIQRNLKEEQMDEVLLLKQFMKSTGTYGSEFRVGGFAGYLAELLVLHYGDFEGVLKGALSWRPGYIIDIEGHGTGEDFQEPLVVVDPVDSKRNVAAALTLQRMAEFVTAARNFLREPKPEYFQKPHHTSDPGEILEIIEKRGSKIILVSTGVPDVPADALYPQLRKTLDSIVRNLKDEGFSVLGADYWSDESRTALMLIEMEVWMLPSYRKRYGPPVWSRWHSDRFTERHERAWVEGSRLVVESPRKDGNAVDYIKNLLSKPERLRMGKHIRKELINGFSVYSIEDIIESLDPEFLMFLDAFLNPWKAIRR
ncbi:CCA tRNA nucleotidyltransferase [Methanothermobacter sp.]|uniref:CCA tRNA nucleotidyltransferase n=1 Tax=Methanothermobacter sp. TaxID=1884223 RepID=UPI003C771245